jgi:hypothetical protein
MSGSVRTEAQAVGEGHAKDTEDRRVQFDFVVNFTNGGWLEGQDFKLDIEGEDISDDQLARYAVAHMNLHLAETVEDVRIRNKKIIVEEHRKRSAAS